MPDNISANVQRTRRRFQEELGTREEVQQRFRATIGDGTGNIEVPGKRNFVYVRREGRSRIEECHNTRVPRRNGLPVIVGHDPVNPDTLQILEPDWGGMASPDNYSYVPYHHESHEFQNADGGDDITWIQSQQYVPLLAYPTDPLTMTVNVYGGWYCWGTDWHYFEATVSADLTGSIPGIVGNARYTLISIDGATETLQYTDGAEFPVVLPPADIEDMIPTAPGGSVPIVAVYLPNGIISIDWANLYDIRMMVATAGMIVPHALLSHTDGVPAAPVQGDLVVGTAAPFWARFARGTAHQLLKMNVAATDPVWASFDWDEVAAAAGADMVHDHSSAAEGGEDITPDALGVNAAVPDQDGAIAQAEVAADPASGGAGTARIYPKDDAGQSKYFFMDDGGGIYEIAGIVEDLTVTVGAAGDFASLQAAIIWIRNWIIKGACVIEELDEAAYDEAVEFSGLLVAPGSTLTLKGDVRVLAGLSYVDGALCNQAALANGGSGTCGISNLGAVITVTGTVTNPDFDADGWIAGDRLLVYNNAHAIAIYDIDSTLNNTITLTVAAPAIGDDGTAICLIPNRSIDRSVAGYCVDVNGCRGIILDGWYLETGSGATCWGAYAHANAMMTLQNVVTYAEDIGICIQGANTDAYASDGAVSVWGGADGMNAQSGYMECYYLVVIGASSRGYYSTHGGKIIAPYALAIHIGARGFYATYTGYIYAAFATARQCVTTGYETYGMSFILANSTTALCNGNGANYNPAPSCTFGNCCAAISYS